MTNYCYGDISCSEFVFQDVMIMWSLLYFIVLWFLIIRNDLSIFIKWLNGYWSTFHCSVIPHHLSVLNIYYSLSLYVIVCIIGTNSSSQSRENWLCESCRYVNQEQSRFECCWHTCESFFLWISNYRRDKQDCVIIVQPKLIIIVLTFVVINSC